MSDIHEVAGPLPQGTEDTPVERLAAKLWRDDNPTMSVFDCDHDMKERYRKRARDTLNSTPRSAT